jgi:hypothetical protein
VSAAALSLVVGLVLGAPPGGAEEHLLAGANAFREERFDVALVEFRVAASLGSPEAATYAATTLVKLNRPEDAVEAFGTGGGAGQDALIDYYRGMACYEARLYHCAEVTMTSVGGRAGPRVASLAADVRAKIATVLAGQPTRESIDWYLDRCSAERGGKRQVLASAYCREAVELSKRRPDRYKLSDAEAGAKG